MGSLHFDETHLFEFFTSEVQITYIKESETGYLIQDIAGIVNAA